MYMSTSDAAEKHLMTTREIRSLIKRGIIAGRCDEMTGRYYVCERSLLSLIDAYYCRDGSYVHLAPNGDEYTGRRD